jgi:hypothetical protein
MPDCRFLGSSGTTFVLGGLVDRAIQKSSQLGHFELADFCKHAYLSSMKNALKPQESNMVLDLLDAKHVEFIVDNTGKVWVNVDGKCVVRIGHADDVEISAPRNRASRCSAEVSYAEVYTGRRSL